MFGIEQKRAMTRAAAKAAKLHSIAAVMRGRSFAGNFEAGGVPYGFTYDPRKSSLIGRRLRLNGGLTVVDGRPDARVPPHSLNNVRATLVSAQGGIGTAPPRKKMPADLSPVRPDLPVVESTGALSFCGVLYFKLSPLDGRALGVPAVMGPLQLNVRLAPANDAERNLQGVFSSIVDALFGKQMDIATASAHIRDLNKILASG
ncbi:MAG: hypothetical protein WAU45_18815 [Blastocatellia bacterium]